MSSERLWGCILTQTVSELKTLKIVASDFHASIGSEVGLILMQVTKNFTFMLLGQFTLKYLIENSHRG